MTDPRDPRYPAYSSYPKLWNMSPFKRMLLGFALVAIGVPSVFGVGIVTVWFIYTIGLLETFAMYVIILLSLAVSLIIYGRKRQGAGFRSVERWDPDAADEAGSTARQGSPHDPYGIIPRYPYTGRRRRPFGD